jgi:hypothetical protein
MVKRPLILMMMFALLLAGCAKAAATPSVGRSLEGIAPQVQPQEAPMPASLDTSAGSFAYESAAVNRIVIRNANMTIVVADPAQAMEAVLKLANDMSGFVVNSQLYQSGERNGVKIQEASVSIRVPAERLEEARSKIMAMVENVKTDVLSDSVTGQDVTQEYTDLQSRLRNEEDAAEQLRKIMDTATKPEDVLQIFNNLKQVSEQIEILKGQIKYYDEASAMSEISVSIQSKESVQPISVAGWSPKGVARNALQALVDIYQFFASAAIWIGITILPIIIPLGLIIFGIVKFIQWQRRKSKMPKVE